MYRAVRFARHLGVASRSLNRTDVPSRKEEDGVFLE